MLSLNSLRLVPIAILAVGVPAFAHLKVSAHSPYQTLYFEDDFNPRPEGDTDECYTKPQRCALNPPDFSVDPCPANQEMAHLKDLNKCVWVPYAGYNFWNTSNKKDTFRTENIEVGNGILTLKFSKNPFYDPNGPKDCGDTTHKELLVDPKKGTNCPFASAGMHSRFQGPNRKGMNGLYGRVEVKAWIQTRHTGYAAFWMWPEFSGRGYPYVAKTEQIQHNPDGSVKMSNTSELDIWESAAAHRRNQRYGTQSLHNWVNGTDADHGGRGHSFTSLKTHFPYRKGWHTYGIERSPGELQFYIDDKYTHTFKDGQKHKSGDHKEMIASDMAEFLIMSLVGENFDEYDGEEKILVDRVRFFR